MKDGWSPVHERSIILRARNHEIGWAPRPDQFYCQEILNIATYELYLESLRWRVTKLWGGGADCAVHLQWMTFVVLLPLSQYCTRRRSKIPATTARKPRRASNTHDSTLRQTLSVIGVARIVARGWGALCVAQGWFKWEARGPPPPVKILLLLVAPNEVYDKT